MKLLIIDDQGAILETLCMFFSDKGYNVITAEYGKEGLQKVEMEQPDIIILDIRLPDINGIEVLKKIKSINEHAFVIMITAFHDMETTIEAMKYGAYDYILKPINIKELNAVVEKAVRILDEKNKVPLYLKGKETPYKTNIIIGKSKPMQEIFKLIGLTCNNRATVLIQGESGTGKELIARVIHYSGILKNEPFICVDCSALVETLIESELFGHEKGAFTHALYTKKGQFELACNGTVFLDEVGELPLGTQAKLLRFLQSREFQRVGGTKIIKSNARIIAATNRDLAQMVKKGKFREDLYFRLKVITINVPSLRERRSDIPLLVDYFLQKISKNLGKKPPRISKQALNKLINYDWPGNVRELENVITRAVVLCKGDIILEEHLTDFVDAEFCMSSEEEPFKSLEEMEKEHIVRALLKAKGHKGKACELLKISRPTLKKKIEKYNIQLSQ